MIYISCNIRCNRHKCLSFWAIFYPFSPLTTQKIKILKMKKITTDIILHVCTINGNHMMYKSWDIGCDGQNCLSFSTFFWPFTPLRIQKIKILKKMKKTSADIIILHKCTKNHNHVLYCSWVKVCDRCNCNCFSFWAISPLCSSPTP